VHLQYVSKLVNVEFLFFMKSHFTTFAQNDLHLNQFAYGHFWSWTVTPFHTSGAVDNGLTGVKDAGVWRPYFFNWS